VVSCEISGIPTFLCMESSSMHFATFIISWQVAGTSLFYKMALWAQGCKPCRKATFACILLSSGWGSTITQRFEHTFPLF
jgi:hypothetical protein